MAKIKGQTAITFIKKSKRRRPGVHAKTKQSSHKHGKHYDKPYVGQGK